jgi:hypothetical protein
MRSDRAGAPWGSRPAAFFAAVALVEAAWLGFLAWMAVAA